MPRKTPTKEAILDYLRMMYEDDPDMACEDTEDLAAYFGCHPKSLYNHDKDSGPLYELWIDGAIQRYEGRREGVWQWMAIGARVEWD